MAEPERTASVTVRNVFTNALLSNYRLQGEKGGWGQRKEKGTERETIRERKKRKLYWRREKGKQRETNLMRILKEELRKRNASLEHKTNVKGR